ncbi:MAG TPA: branched-chain amino acid ABC transporter ATP-binding protein/permease [Pseudolabrys sp.]|jgi:branched-chain amino acid transport system permease protein
MTDPSVAAKSPPARQTKVPLAGVLLLTAGVLGAVAPLVFSMQPYLVSLLMQASTYAIAVLGLTIVLGYAGQINLAQAAFFGIGAYSVGLGTASFGLPFSLSLLIGVGAATICGAVLGFASLRVGGHYLAMVTISFQTILSLVLINWVSFTHGPDGVPNIERPTWFGHAFGDGQYLALSIAMLCAIGFLVLSLPKTRLGRAMQALRDNELAAEVVGVDTYRTKVIAFALSSFLGGLGGGLFAGGFSYVSPDQFTFSESVVFLTMVLLGGVRSPFGAMLGTALLILLPEWLRFLKVVYLAVYGAAVILIMVFMPDGIWGFFSMRWRKLRPEAAAEPHEIAPLPLVRQVATDAGRVVLTTDDLSKHFGGLKALEGVSFAVRSNDVHALIGPNGSGKTTMLNVLSGIYQPTRGRITFGGRVLANLQPHQRAGLGLGRTFQNIRLFTAMTVLENVIVGAERPNNSVAGGEAELKQHALAALDFVGLAHRAHEQVGSLSYGHQRLVEIARTLAGSPKLILLDEPGAGLNHVEKSELVGLLKRLKGHGLTILIIDHDMNLVEQVADHITVLNFGRRIADGSPAEVLSHPDVIAAYLGEATSRVAS